MIYDSIVLQKRSNQLGVVRNTFEKVIRLSEIIRYINTNQVLKNKLALKGGTAINLLYSNLPSLSVDIDLDFALNLDKDEMQKNRELIKQELEMHFTKEGYVLSKHSRFSFALDSYVISYTPSGGGSDNIKVEINYAMRSHLLPLEHKKLDLGIIEQPFMVLTVSKIELYAGKVNALLSRSQIRDLYDMYQMITNQLFDFDEVNVLKNVVLFYRYIQNDRLDFERDFTKKFIKRSFVRDLLPVIKKKDVFNLNEAIPIVLEFVDQITDYDSNQQHFIHSIDTDSPRFDYLFQDEGMIKQASSHPLVQWKKLKRSINL